MTGRPTTRHGTTLADHASEPGPDSGPPILARVPGRKTTGSHARFGNLAPATVDRTVPSHRDRPERARGSPDGSLDSGAFRPLPGARSQPTPAIPADSPTRSWAPALDPSGARARRACGWIGAVQEMRMRTARTRSGIACRTLASGVPTPRCAPTGSSASRRSTALSAAVSSGRSPPVTRKPRSVRGPRMRSTARSGSVHDLLGLVVATAGVALLRPAPRGSSPVDVPGSDLALPHRRAVEHRHGVARAAQQQHAVAGGQSCQRIGVQRPGLPCGQPRRQHDLRPGRVTGDQLPAGRVGRRRREPTGRAARANPSSHPGSRRSGTSTTCAGSGMPDRVRPAISRALGRGIDRVIGQALGPPQVGEQPLDEQLDHRGDGAPVSSSRPARPPPATPASRAPPAASPRRGPATPRRPASARQWPARISSSTASTWGSPPGRPAHQRHVGPALALHELQEAARPSRAAACPRPRPGRAGTSCSSRSPARGHDGRVEVRLGREVVEHQGARDAGGGGHLVEGQLVDRPGLQQVQADVDQLLATIRGGHARWPRVADPRRSGPGATDATHWYVPPDSARATTDAGGVNRSPYVSASSRARATKPAGPPS